MDTRALDEILGGGVMGALESIFERMEWADDEIARAQKRHPAHADTLYHSFGLLVPTNERMSTEFVYRSHCRELLDRVAAGQDTRPGTAAEVCAVCCESSMVAPLTDDAAGLYGRMWAAAGFPGDQFSARQEHHEALSSPQIDDLERESRRKLAQADRKLGAIDCQGMHHGEQVACQYAATAAPVQLALIA